MTLDFARGSATARYDAEIKRLRTQLGRTPESLCVIDMSGSGAPVMAGWELDKPLQIASMAKLALLLAAAQLRDDVQSVVQWAGLKKWRDVAPTLTRAWLKGKAPAFKALVGQPSSLPQFDAIFNGERFDAAADAVPEFRSSWPSIAKHGRHARAHLLAINDLHARERPTAPPESLKTRDPKEYDRKRQKYESDFTEFYDSVLAPVPFDDLLLLAIKWSDNEAASACLSRLGLPYVWAVLHQLGLYDERAQQGLWLGNVYRSLFSSKVFRSPGRLQSKRIATRVAQHEGDDEKTPTSTQVGTARICCLVFAALVQGTLFQRSNQLALDYLEFRPGDVAVGNVPTNFKLFSGEMVPGKFGQTLMHLSKIGILGTLWSEGAYLLHLPNPVEAPADAGAAPPDPTRLLGRSVAVCALHASADVIASAGKGVLEISDKLGV